MKFTTGYSHPNLAQQIADRLTLTLEQPIIKVFKNQEISVQVDISVEREDCYVFQSLSYPIHDHLIELLILINELKQRNPRNIIAIIPYFGYGRSSSNARLMAKLLESVGIDHLLTIGLHSDEIENFFTIPVINLDLIKLFGCDIERRLLKDNLLIVSPDKGGEKRAQTLAAYLQTDYIVLDKKRCENGTVEIARIQRNLKDKNCIIVDDIIDSGATLVAAAEALKEAEALSIDAYVIHAILSEGCLEKLKHIFIRSLVITDTIRQPKLDLNTIEIRVLKVAETLGNAVKRLKEI